MTLNSLMTLILRYFTEFVYAMFAFSAMALLVVWQEGHPAYKN